MKSEVEGEKQTPTKAKKKVGTVERKGEKGERNLLES